MSSFSVSIGQVFDAAESPIEQDVICELGKSCNAVHALELKHGPLPFKVVWEGAP